MRVAVVGSDTFLISHCQYVRSRPAAEVPGLQYIEDVRGHPKALIPLIE